MSPPFGSRACAAMTDSSSDPSRTGAAIASTAKDAAAALKGFSQYSAYVADTGLNSIATRTTRGAERWACHVDGSGRREVERLRGVVRGRAVAMIASKAEK